MEPLEIAEALKGRFPDEVLGISEFRDQVSVAVKRDRILDICRTLHDEPDFSFDYLADLCGVDFLGKRTPRFEVVYNVFSMKHRVRLFLKAEVPEDAPEIESVTPVWIGADWHEREAYDMYGIRFMNHPDLRRVLMPEDWEGHPLRKDYPLKGPGPAEEWKGYLAVKKIADDNREFQWKQ